jgi:hypothetical protein
VREKRGPAGTAPRSVTENLPHCPGDLKMAKDFPT